VRGGQARMTKSGSGGGGRESNPPAQKTSAFSRVRSSKSIEKRGVGVGTLLALDRDGFRDMIGGDFSALARNLAMVGNACDESCARLHDGHACEHGGHPCGCLHSESYNFDWEPPDELIEHWSDSATASLLHFLSHLPGDLAADEIELRLEWWWRGENRRLRSAMESNHRRVCERGRGVLVNRVTGEVIRARCKSWRECDYCAWVYGCQVERLLNQVKGLRAFVVFTMPPERGDWSNKDHIAAQARAIHRLRERLYRKFGQRRFSMVWTREHNTHFEGSGRLHLNVAWDIDWLDQQELSQMADACGFGRVVNIQRIGRDASSTARYATKCLRYASKELRKHADWPRGTRRWSASRAARSQMQSPARNPDWYWSPVDPPLLRIGNDSDAIKAAWAERSATGERLYWLFPESYLPSRAALAEGQSRAGPSPPIQLNWQFHTPWPEIP
jgi:hypothetical protein